MSDKPAEAAPIAIRRLEPGDEARVHEAAHLFDDPPRGDATRRFLREPTHHLLMAHQEDTPVGFASGVEVTHPDKGTEMMLYELSVDEPFRRRGIGRALVRRFADLARERGCEALFVLTEDENTPALATYAFGGAVREDGIVMFTWKPLR